ncbi:gluconate 2-dehydrogenase [Erwinia sp. OLTSP20]|uniref:gluconate 2-dehydrogenase subunit 3 family protein n=1 Tax=unclassified Erwinia TaxID=2622719 RepID=UPI000C1A2A87|nr:MULTISPECIES: gluconate 2-dehydrogenase subunit 3 family protein [unclassified Erwinia]PIJ50312.1 gluconate 2-dehydrogenase [Erwinia sp. OAMSP11]PIJ72150.1 gluconate 2-dehydrogenase [Erwinia sp. OLSSP12]PIJ81441.1 gluconate 2-dehydrogenase [Erwinia sp. OLCASP19]PIJ84147.1 gluconate 2-dehydrogenase [Erwinia sp. OLMTSP26]PIJ85846.1 gluconate 2-dehydrogenase [Erwinia sp. OLMDSP33]
MSKKSNEGVPSRRRFLQKTLSIIPLAAVGSSSVVSLGSLAADADTKAEGVSAHYVPVFFNNDEWRFILAATDRLIPTDANGPGAVSEGVPVFIDKQMELPYGYGHLWYMQAPYASAPAELGYQSNLVPRETYRRGIKAVNGHCQQQFQKVFADLSHQQQEDILHQLEQGKLTFDDVPGKLFFEQLLENTKEGYLADPLHGGNQTLASWKLIGFPGARADYQQVMDNPNKPYPLGPVSISGKRSV